MMGKKFDYDQALTQIQDIVSEIQNPEIGLNDIANKIKKAKLLLQQCQEYLRGLESEIDET